jgi:hypothetical protein
LEAALEAMDARIRREHFIKGKTIRGIARDLRVLLNGVTVIVKVAHVRLCHSRMLFVRAYPRETSATTGRSAAKIHPRRRSITRAVMPGSIRKAILPAMWASCRPTICVHLKSRGSIALGEGLRGVPGPGLALSHDLMV